MTGRNRVTPTGAIEEFALRGAWTGNRGILHRGREIVRFHAGERWITCALEFRGRWREQWGPNRWTPLYFHDEAVAFAAGHRPCGECRHGQYTAYREAWSERLRVPPPAAKELDRRLHGERLVPGTHRRRFHDLPWAGLPDGTFVLREGRPALVLDGHLIEWTRQGYGPRFSRPRTGPATVLTPPSTVAALRAGCPVQIDEGARR
ncbi:hypothetical protein [Amycolatopsis sp. PS_44_ISF1]|uniref:hypothetical protein n=1 Tax=Amycolatopsis sp. PS_44_ISF1 TaxID=2974917 RepID=UPI0028DD8BED|nr:hypothetical protein [Amycolatopsis sp. PS_44_ISF1]MDT8913442.1 hypothetical protein [Amycolatopsis sp. PS_44_ISF1]